jgi:hypothetical protein
LNPCILYHEPQYYFFGLGVRDQYDTTNFKILEGESAQHDSLTKEKASDVIVSLNLALAGT